MSEDLISRQALLKAMYERAFETDGDTMWQSGCWVRYRAIEDVIKSQPSTQPEILACGEGELNVPDTNVGDMIGRHEAIDAVRRLQTYKLFEGDDMLLVDKAEVQTELMMLPSAQWKGRWISQDDGRWFAHHVFKCSICGNIIDSHGVNAGRGDINFCPNCGAAMKGGDK